MWQARRPLDLGIVALNVRRGDGAGRAMLELARALAARGHAVHVYTHELEMQELGASVASTALPWARGPQLFAEMLVFATATRMLRRARHDLVVMMGAIALPPRPFVMYAQFAAGGWMATWDRGGAPGAYHRVHTRISRALERVVLARASGLIACSEAVASELGSDGVARHELPQTVIVPNGVALGELGVVDAAQRQAARRRLGCLDAYVVGFIGEYKTGRKGLDLLLEGIAAGAPDEHLLIAGAGPADVVDQAAGRLGLAGRVHQLGVVDAREVLRAADVVVVPSRYEPFSLVALEAAASGLPVVLAPAVGAVPYLGSGAVVLEQLDARSIRAALDELRADPGAARAIGQRGREAARALDWSATTAGAVAFVEELAR